MTTIPQIRDRHELEERELIYSELVRNRWYVATTARALGVSPGALRKMLVSHRIELKHRLPVGRPRKTP
jgi:transcriptional regulator with GAF, ATPase, and Fis domain